MKKRMIKLLALMSISVMTVTSAIPVFAEKESTAVESNEINNETSILGKWYGSAINIGIIYDFKDDGTYTFKFADDNEEIGNWKIDNKNNITLDEGTPSEMTLEYDEKNETLKTKIADVDCVFSRNPEDAEQETANLKSADEAKAFDGIWKCDDVRIGSGSVSVLNVKIPIKTFSIDYLFMNIKDKKIDLNALYNQDQYLDIKELPTEFVDGALKFNLSDITDMEKLMDEAGDKINKKDIEAVAQEDCILSLAEGKDGETNIEFSISASDVNVSFVFTKASEEEIKKVIK